MRLLIALVVLLMLPAAAFADVCAVGYAELEDAMLEVAPNDCVSAAFDGVEWGGCSGDPVLWVTNDCDTPLLLDSISGATALSCGPTQWDVAPCDRLEPGERGMVILPAPDIGAVQTIEIVLSPEVVEGEEPSIQVTGTYGAVEVENRGGRGGSGAICTTSHPSAPAGTGAFVLLVVCGVMFARRRADAV